MSLGYVRRLDGDALREMFARLKPGEYLWQEDYPGKQRLSPDPMPGARPRTGRVIGPEFELRFFDRGARGVLLQERPFDTARSGDQTFETHEWSAESRELTDLASDNRLKDWRLSLVEYKDRMVGGVRWTRWRGERTARTKDGGQDA